jgi:uncharacterized membrane protein YdcZ (DUF606 family)
MILSFVLPVILGFAIVLQSGANRTIARDWGLGPTALVGALSLTAISVTLWALSRGAPGIFPEMFRDRAGFANPQWWYWVPGCIGFCIIVGVPMSIARVGALQTFVFIIAAQVIGTMLWDLWFEGQPITWPRAVGGLVTIAGAALTTLKR